MTRKTLDPNLASILDSIRATVGGEPAPQPAAEPGVEPDQEDTATEEAVEPAAAAPKARSPKKSAAAPAQQAKAQPASPSGSGRTVEDFLAELIRPQVDAWLKANLPELIQKMAAEEIARLTGRK